MEARNGNVGEDIRRLPEYVIAWELEMWRRSEQSKWLAELKQQEICRITALEKNCKKKEKQRVVEMRAFQVEQADLEAKLRATLCKLEKRERTVTAAKDGLTHREEALERAYANRTSEAQVVIKKLQAECEHRLELERRKFAALQEQYILLQQKFLTSNSSLAALEKEFQDYKSAQRSATESDLLRQISAFKQQCSTLQRNTQLALHSRDDYRSQVMKMAKELGKLHNIQDVQRHRTTQETLRLQSQVVAANVESGCEKARADRLELQHVKQQLKLLRLQEHHLVIKPEVFVRQSRCSSSRVPLLDAYSDETGSTKLAHPLFVTRLDHKHHSVGS